MRFHTLGIKSHQGLITYVNNTKLKISGKVCQNNYFMLNDYYTLAKIQHHSTLIVVCFNSDLLFLQSNIFC